MRYKHWEMIEELPKGWVVDKTAGSPLCGYEFCTNNKSPLKGQKRALVAVEKKPVIVIDEEATSKRRIEPKTNNSQLVFKFPEKLDGLVN